VLAPASSADAPLAAGAAALSQRFHAVIDKVPPYFNAYADAWTNGLAKTYAPELKPEWGAALAAIKSSPDAPAITAALESVASAAQDALEQVRPAAEALPDGVGRAPIQSLKAALDRARASLAAPAGPAALGFWRDLPSDAAQARARVLARPVAAVAVARPGEPTDFVQAYWRGVTLGALRSLGESAAGLAIQGAQALKARLHFPLAPPAPGAPELGAADLAALKADVAALATSAAAPAPTGDPDADRSLERLRVGDPLPAADAMLLDRLAKALPLLPTSDSERQTCTIVVLDATHRSTQPGGLITGTVNTMAIVNAGQEAPADQQVNVFDQAERPVVTLNAPGTPQDILFYVTSNAAAGKAVARVSVPSAWAGMYLVAKHKGVQTDGERKVWQVEVPVEYAGKTNSLWLRLTFGRPLPEGLWDAR
jgi:hypothetical protein